MPDVVCPIIFLKIGGQATSGKRGSVQQRARVTKTVLSMTRQTNSCHRNPDAHLKNIITVRNHIITVRNHIYGGRARGVGQRPTNHIINPLPLIKVNQL